MSEATITKKPSVVSKESHFYKAGAQYWANIPATLDGVLGGYGHISEVDLKGSKKFLEQIFELNRATAREVALDCGAGIGRVTKNILIPEFQVVDIAEQDSKFIQEIRNSIGKSKNLGMVYQTGLQDFQPNPHYYDLIWCQWVIGNIKDYDLVEFLKNCKRGLKERGVIVVKENIADGEEIQYDETDHSVTRPLELMKIIFKEAKLKIIKEMIQPGFPEDLYPVHMFALV